jgi:NAD kinase
MAHARLDDGQQLLALNEIFVGHRTHQSARYRIRPADEQEERHSSSGVIVSTGTGATGWARSIQRSAQTGLPPAGP